MVGGGGIKWKVVRHPSPTLPPPHAPVLNEFREWEEEGGGGAEAPRPHRLAGAASPPRPEKADPFRPPRPPRLQVRVRVRGGGIPPFSSSQRGPERRGAAPADPIAPEAQREGAQPSGQRAGEGCRPGVAAGARG